MRIIDANILLRYVLCDHEELSAKAKQIIEENVVEVPIEVLCEVVYVLLHVYKVERTEISQELQGFFKNTACILPRRSAVISGLDIFAKTNLDFVDCILAGYNSTEEAEIDTFDRKLLKMLGFEQLIYNLFFPTEERR